MFMPNVMGETYIDTIKPVLHAYTHICTIIIGTIVLCYCIYTYLYI